MRIKKLRLENFGLFRGFNELDLEPKTRYGTVRPIVLVGGKNGAGKTTILEAIRLCLYGPLSLGERVSSKQYEEYLRGRIHRDDEALINAQTASVSLEFEHAELGRQSIYEVERSWDVEDSGLHMHLSVKRDDEPLDELDHAHADEFLRDMIPPGVSQLYFFDGEKIQELAESEDDDATLADAIRSLLGLDLVDRLRGDLRIYSNRLNAEPGVEPLKEQLEALESEMNDCQERCLKARAEEDQGRSRVDDITRKIARAERKIANEGGAFAKKREKLEGEKKGLQQQVEDAENDIRKLAEGLLPFSLCPTLCEQLREQLIAEEKLVAWNAHSSLMEERIAKAKRAATKKLLGSDIELETGQKKRFGERLSKLLDSLSAPPNDLPDTELVHRLSEDQQQRLLNGIDRAKTDIPEQSKRAYDRLEKTTRKLRKVESALTKAPKDDQLQPIVEEITELNRSLGEAQAELRRYEAEVASAEFAFADFKRKEGKLNEKLRDGGKTNEKREMVLHTEAALEEYIELLTASKAKELSDAVQRRFAQLWRKGDVVDRIAIDEKSFRVELFDRHGREVPKTQLSAGEKQMYAISMLWGLAEVSGRPLPMVIDTPLGRLDGDHRGHLVERYFPHASHQVIVLSTDTEIDQTYFNDLQTTVSHSFQLRYDQADARTVIEEGYFWKRRKKELTNAN